MADIKGFLSNLKEKISKFNPLPPPKTPSPLDKKLVSIKNKVITNIKKLNPLPPPTTPSTLDQAVFSTIKKIYTPIKNVVTLPYTGLKALGALGEKGIQIYENKQIGYTPEQLSVVAGYNTQQEALRKASYDPMQEAMLPSTLEGIGYKQDVESKIIEGIGKNISSATTEDQLNKAISDAKKQGFTVNRTGDKFSITGKDWSKDYAKWEEDWTKKGYEINKTLLPTGETSYSFKNVNLEKAYAELNKIDKYGISKLDRIQSNEIKKAQFALAGGAGFYYWNRANVGAVQGATATLIPPYGWYLGAKMATQVVTQPVETYKSIVLDPKSVLASAGGFAFGSFGVKFAKAYTPKQVVVSEIEKDYDQMLVRQTYKVYKGGAPTDNILSQGDKLYQSDYDFLANQLTERAGTVGRGGNIKWDKDVVKPYSDINLNSITRIIQNKEYMGNEAYYKGIFSTESFPTSVLPKGVEGFMKANEYARVNFKVGDITAKQFTKFQDIYNTGKEYYEPWQRELISPTFTEKGKIIPGAFGDQLIVKGMKGGTEYTKLMEIPSNADLSTMLSDIKVSAKYLKRVGISNTYSDITTYDYLGEKVVVTKANLVTPPKFKVAGYDIKSSVMSVPSEDFTTSLKIAKTSPIIKLSETTDFPEWKFQWLTDEYNQIYGFEKYLKPAVTSTVKNTKIGEAYLKGITPVPLKQGGGQLVFDIGIKGKYEFSPIELYKGTVTYQSPSFLAVQNIEDFFKTPITGKKGMMSSTIQIPDFLQRLDQQRIINVKTPEYAMNFESMSQSLILPLPKGLMQDITSTIPKQGLTPLVMPINLLQQNKILLQQQNKISSVTMQRNMLNTRSVQNSILRQENIQKQIIKQQQKLQQQQVQEVITIGEVGTIPTQPPIIPVTPVPAPIVPFPNIMFDIPILDNELGIRKGKKRKRIKGRYAPSLRAVYFGYAGKRPKLITGLSARPASRRTINLMKEFNKGGIRL